MFFFFNTAQNWLRNVSLILAKYLVDFVPGGLCTFLLMHAGKSPEAECRKQMVFKVETLTRALLGNLLEMQIP